MVALHEVLLAAVRWQPDRIEEAIRIRATRPGMDVSQQALWLAAGLFLSPKEYLPAVVAFVGEGEEARWRQVVRFLAPDDLPALPVPWDTMVLKTLIELLGSQYTPWRPGSSGYLSSEEEDRLRVEGLISRWATTLASRTDHDACDALQSLVENLELNPWHLRLGAERVPIGTRSG